LSARQGTAGADARDRVVEGIPISASKPSCSRRWIGADVRTARIKELTEALAKGRVDSGRGGKGNRRGGRGAQGQYRQDAQGARESRRERRRGPALALPDDFRPSRGRRSCEGDGRNLPGMPDCVCRPSYTTRSRSISRYTSAPKLPARAVITKSRQQRRRASRRVNHFVECEPRRGFRASLAGVDPCTRCL